MTSPENAGQQLQPYLSGLEPVQGTAKEPHQMSPEEFLSDPRAVFHTTRRSDEEWRAQDKPTHVGTYRAAIERQLTSRDGSDARMHAGWMTPETLSKSGFVETDRVANLEGIDKSARFYLNEVEDPGSISVSLPNPRGMKTHAEYVKEAIESGKGDEVHPVTMQRYKAGNLSSWSSPSWAAKQYARYREPDAVVGTTFDTKPDLLTPNVGRISQGRKKWEEGSPDYGPTPRGLGLTKDNVSTGGRILLEGSVGPLRRRPERVSDWPEGTGNPTRTFDIKSSPTYRHLKASVGKPQTP